MASPTGGTEMRRTLSLTGLTVNAMALIAPGAFLWTTLQSQAAQSSGGSTTAMDMWPALVFSLILAFLTAISYAELSNIYPHAGAGSSYFFAEAAFLDKQKQAHYRWARIAKFLVGWISHLYYWIYPGIMVAFSATLIVFVLGMYGIDLNIQEEIAVAAAFAIFNGYVAFRGISGSTVTAMAINVIQLVTLVAVSILAIVYRQTHGDVQYVHSTALSILRPHAFQGLIFQSTIAILLLVGFESVTALGAEARDPKRDIKRGILLSLGIQGLFAYLFEYFAANYFVGSQMTATGADGSVLTGYDAAAQSGSPLGDMVHTIGNWLVAGSGNTFTLIVAATVILALIGTTLACLNTGVRITYAMGRDKEMPSILGALHGRFATPHWGIWILVAVSAVIGAYGVIDVDKLTQVVLASNTGTFLLYGLTNLICLIAFWRRVGSNVVTHKMVPVLGLAANLFELGAVIYLAMKGSPATARDAYIAIGAVVVWLIVGMVWFVYNTYRQKHPVFSDGASQPQATV